MINRLLLCCGILLPGMVFADYPQHTTSVECCPEVIAPGDTLYIEITAHNPYEESIFVPGSFSMGYNGAGSIRMDIVEWEMPLLTTKGVYDPHSDRGLWSVELKPGESRGVYWPSRELPPLEMLHDAKYEAFMSDLPPEGRELTLRIKVNSFAEKPAEKPGARLEDFSVTLEKKFTFRPRSEKEMALIETWYDETPKEWFPQINPNIKNPAYKTVNWSPYRKIPRFYVGYPGSLYDSKTWEDWKELEDSLAPCTLRDEIRRKRFSMQYKATQDENVVEEFKTWVKTLPPLQRRRMAFSASADPQLREAFKELREE